LRESREIQLLFTDIVMPGGLFGPELASQASRLRPDLKILFTSGYSEQPVTSRDGTEARILNKPYRRNDLASMLHSVLKGK
jgi:DNA-binding LytR/AlgR family response regulator